LTVLLSVTYLEFCFTSDRVDNDDDEFPGNFEEELAFMEANGDLDTEVVEGEVSGQT